MAGSINGSGNGADQGCTQLARGQTTARPPCPPGHRAAQQQSLRQAPADLYLSESVLGTACLTEGAGLGSPTLDAETPLLFRVENIA